MPMSRYYDTEAILSVIIREESNEQGRARLEEKEMWNETCSNEAVEGRGGGGESSPNNSHEKVQYFCQSFCIAECVCHHLTY